MKFKVKYDILIEVSRELTVEAEDEKEAQDKVYDTGLDHAEFGGMKYGKDYTFADDAIVIYHIEEIPSD